MKHLFFLSAIALVIFTMTLQAQETGSTLRLEKQNKLSATAMKPRLAEYETNILKTLEVGNPTMQAQALQTLRELEQLFPAYTFAKMLLPVEAKLKDENTDAVVRWLAALALDELHSDAGDAVIREVAGSSADKGLQILCNALLVRSQYKAAP
jgi:hypothetical protein